MAETPSAVELQDLGDRPFSFYPPILNIEHNDWLVKKCDWSEVLVENPRMGIELWVPRTWIGEISKVDTPRVIIGLRREVEYKAGSLVPHHKRVIGLPQIHSAEPIPISELPKRPTLADEFRSNAAGEASLLKTLALVLAVAIVVVFAAVGLSRLRNTGGAVSFEAVEQRNLAFTADSTYFDVVQRFGSPEEDRWRPGGGERQVRALVYRKEKMIILLMGPEQNNGARYIGAKDFDWRTIHAVALPGGRTTEATLANLQRF